MDTPQPLSADELRQLRDILAGDLSPGISPHIQRRVVDTALHYEELAAKYLAHRANNRAAQGKYRRQQKKEKPCFTP